MRETREKLCGVFLGQENRMAIFSRSAGNRHERRIQVMQTQVNALEAQIADKNSEIALLEQRVNNEVRFPWLKEIEEYKRTNKEPRVPFFSFGKTRRMAEEKLKEYEGGINAINEKYQNNPLAKKLTTLQTEVAKLQEQCHHDYGRWRRVSDDFEISVCRGCYHERRAYTEEEGAGAGDTGAYSH